MSTLEPRQALYQYLIADNTVKSVISNRLFQGSAPGDTAKPYLVIWPPISRTRVLDLAGVAYYQTRLQITAVADTQTSAEAAADAVISAADCYVGPLAGSFDTFEMTVDNDFQVKQEDVDEVEHHIDILIKHK